MKRFLLPLTALFLCLSSGLVAQEISEPQKARILRQLQKVPNKVVEQKYREALTILEQALPVVKALMKDDFMMRTVYGYSIYMKGLSHLELEEYTSAEADLIEFIRGYPKHPNAMKARLLLGESYLYQEDWEGIVKAIPAVIKSRLATLNEKMFAHQLLAEAFFTMEMWPEAKPHLGWLFRNADDADIRMNAASRLAVAMVRLAEYKELYSVMPRLHQTDAKYDINLNLTLLEEGDEFLMDDRPDLALLMFRMVVPYSELEIKLASRRQQAEQRLERLRNIASNGMGTLNQQIRGLERLLEELGAEEEDLEAYPDYDLELRIRLGDVYYALQRWEEAIQLYLSIYDRAPETEIAERAMYSAYMTAFEAAERIRAWEIAKIYMDAYPGGEYWDDVTLHASGLLIQLERWFETEELVTRALEVSPDHVMKDNMLFNQGYALFMQSKIQGAIDVMSRVLDEFPRTNFRIAARYWKALGHLFQQEYPQARTDFNKVVTEAKGGGLREDGFYRMGVAAYGEGDFAGAKSILDDFLREYPDSHLASEAHAMIGDIFASDSRLDEAIERYKRAVDTAHMKEDGSLNMVQVDYATFQQARTYELENRWQEIIDLFDRYMERFAEQGPNYTEATYWKGNALKRLGKDEEALQLFYDAIVTYGNETDAFGIDFIMRDLTMEIQEMMDRPAGIGEQRSAVVELKDRLNNEIERAMEEKKQTLLLRLRSLQYQTTENEEIREIIKNVLLNETNIPDASPYTLDLMGRVADKEENLEFAREVYEYFIENYEDSDLILFALVGLSENRIAEERYGEAIDMLKAITDRYPTLPQAAESYIRLGDVYRMVDEREKAIEMYTLILTVKDWRGELWPRALMKIGDTHAEKNEYEKAFGFYQRVYLMYVGYEEYAATAYYKSAQMLRELGKDGEAKETLQEMLNNETMAGQPVASDARLLILKIQ